MLVIAIAVPLVFADQSIAHTQTIQLNLGDTLVFHSDQTSIQRVFVSGNLSTATLAKPETYPARGFSLSASQPGSYEVKMQLNNSNDYTVNLYVITANGQNTNSSSFYISGGPFELDVNATFVPQQTSASAILPSESPWQSFTGWMDNFGQAFPLWVKVLYLVLGMQFFAVGGLWIRRESNKKESAGQTLDYGDRAFLWLDVAYKFLLVSFVAIVAIMGGELLILFILRFMFLATFQLLSLWDLFVVGFAAGILVMVYLIRFTLEKAFDLKPMEEE